MSKRGRPSKFTPATRRKILASVRQGLPLSHCCVAAAITPNSLASYRDASPPFDAALQRAAAKGIERRLSVVTKCLKSKDENTRFRAATWLLTHCPGSAEIFSEASRVKLSDAQGNPLPPPVIAPQVIFVQPDNGRNPHLPSGPKELVASGG